MNGDDTAVEHICRRPREGLGFAPDPARGAPFTPELRTASSTHGWLASRGSADWMTFVGDLQEARRSARSPEHVNDGTDTHPSARLRKLRPRYGKVRHGVAVSARIGLGRMRAECGHFARWLTRVENLTRLDPGR